MPERNRRHVQFGGVASEKLRTDLIREFVYRQYGPWSIKGLIRPLAPRKKAVSTSYCLEYEVWRPRSGEETFYNTRFVSNEKSTLLCRLIYLHFLSTVKLHWNILLFFWSHLVSAMFQPYRFHMAMMTHGFNLHCADSLCSNTRINIEGRLVSFILSAYYHTLYVIAYTIVSSCSRHHGLQHLVG